METRLWGVDEIERKGDGRATLRSVVRIDRAVLPDLVLESLLARGALHMLGVALN